MSERVEGLHSINKQHAVKMVGLVLDNARGEAVTVSYTHLTLPTKA